MQWVMNNTTTVSSYQALTDSALFRAPKEDFLYFLKQNPEPLFFYMSKTLKRLSEASQRLEAALLGNASEKVGNILIFLAENLGEKEGKTIMLQVPFTHQEIADMVGFTRETTSLELEKLQKEGIISQKDHFLTIQDIEKLKVLTDLT